MPAYPFSPESALLFEEEAARGWGRIIFYDELGRRIEERQEKRTQMRIDTDDRNEELYPVRYRCNKELSVRKVGKTGDRKSGVQPSSIRPNC